MSPEDVEGFAAQGLAFVEFVVEIVDFGFDLFRGHALLFGDVVLEVVGLGHVFGGQTARGFDQTVALGRVLAGSLCTKVRIIIRDEGMRIFLARFLDLCCIAFFLRRRALGLVAGRRIM